MWIPFIRPSLFHLCFLSFTPVESESYVIQGLVPDFILRFVIRALLRQRLREIDHGSLETNLAAKMDWIENVRASENIAEAPEKANEQHYEVNHPSSSESGYCQCVLPRCTGFYEIYTIHIGPVRQIFVVSISDRKGNTRGSRNPDVGKLLRQGSVDGWIGYLGFRLWYVGFHL